MYNSNIDKSVSPVSPLDFLTWLQDRPAEPIGNTVTAVTTTMQTAAETDRINRKALEFTSRLAKVINA